MGSDGAINSVAMTILSQRKRLSASCSIESGNRPPSLPPPPPQFLIQRPVCYRLSYRAQQDTNNRPWEETQRMKRIKRL